MQDKAGNEANGMRRHKKIYPAPNTELTLNGSLHILLGKGFMPCRETEKMGSGMCRNGNRRGCKMKVLMVNGSPHANGNTYIALHEMEKIFAQEGIETEILHIGNKAIRGCISCRSCKEKGKCVFDDMVNEAAPKLEACDGLVVGSPVYYASANATLMAFLTRLFFSTPFDKTMKVGAGVVAARRGGLSSTFDELNKFFTICGMPVASGQYWNSIHGAAPGEAEQDEEGLQIMRTLAANMTFLMKSIALGKEKYGLPEKEPFRRTNFIR